MGILITLFILSILVFIHEAGHFFAAKKFGIKVEEFGFGIPPRAWGKKIGETIYSLNWLPIGGFVKLYGEDEAGAGRISVKGTDRKATSKEDKDRAYYTRPVWQRAIVVVAGVVMNALLAFVIYYAYLAISGYQTTIPLLAEHKFFGLNQVNVNTDEKDSRVVTVVMQGSPADKAGIKAPARIVALNNQQITSSEDIISVINKNKGKAIPVTWQELTVAYGELREGARKSSTITPRQNPPEFEGPTGIAFLPTALLAYETPAQKVFSGITHPLNLMAYNYTVMKELVGLSVRQRTVEPVSQGVSGPVQIVSLGGTINKIEDMRERVLQFLNLAGLLSISLAFFNVLPIPALDGGRLFFILIEGIFRRKVSERFETAVHSIGMAVLIALILLVTFKDVLQLLR